MCLTLYQLYARESEDTAIKISDLMLLNKGANRKFELGGGFTTGPRFHPWILKTDPIKQTKALLFNHLILLSKHHFLNDFHFQGGFMRLGPW